MEEYPVKKSFNSLARPGPRAGFFKSELVRSKVFFLMVNIFALLPFSSFRTLDTCLLGFEIIRHRFRTVQLIPCNTGKILVILTTIAHARRVRRVHTMRTRRPAHGRPWRTRRIAGRAGGRRGRRRHKWRACTPRTRWPAPARCACPGTTRASTSLASIPGERKKEKTFTQLNYGTETRQACQN